MQTKLRLEEKVLIIPNCRSTSDQQQVDENYLTINYKKIKKKKNAMNSVLLSLLYIYVCVLGQNFVRSEQFTVSTCEAETQKSIFETLPQCKTRSSLVDLRQYFADNHDVIQVCIC